MSVKLVLTSNYLILCHPLLLLPSILPNIRVFPNESVLHIRWPKYWSFIHNISPSNEYSGLMSFRIDWSDHLVVQGTPQSLLQHHSSKASILQLSAFFIVQLSHTYMTTGKTIALTRWTSVGKVMSLLFNMLSRLVIAFLPRRKHLLISWLQSPSAVIFEPKKIKFLSVSIVSPSIGHKVMGLDAMIFVFWMLNFKPIFSLSSFTFIKRLFSSPSLSALRVVSSAYLRLLTFLLAIWILLLKVKWKWEWSHSIVSGCLRPMDCSPPSSSVYGILQARKLEWVAILTPRWKLFLWLDFVAFVIIMILNGLPGGPWPPAQL